MYILPQGQIVETKTKRQFVKALQKANKHVEKIKITSNHGNGKQKWVTNSGYQTGKDLERRRGREVKKEGR